MNFIFSLLLMSLGALAYANEFKIDQYGKHYKVADKVFLQKQKDILRLFKYVIQANYYKDQTQIAKNYKIEEHLDNYTHQEYVKQFVHDYKQGLLTRGTTFSIFYEKQQEETIGLFNVLYYAKDWETFYKTACWAREYTNDGMFVYAMHAAILHRNDTQGIVLPPIYEINPYLFINSDPLDMTYEYKMRQGNEYKTNKPDRRYFDVANYTGWYLNNDPEQHSLAYFTEDVGLNSYYYYFNLDYPFWMGGEEYGLNKNRRGELFYFVHQQLLARYYMARLSNGYGSIPLFNWEEPIKTGYSPSMRYPNGLEFPIRPANAHLIENPRSEPYSTILGEDNLFKIQQIEDYERRIRDAIDFGFVVTEDGKKISLYEEDGFNTLGNIITSNPDSVNNRFYGYLLIIAHNVLGYSPHPTHAYKIQPSALEHFESALRDPVFYQFYKRIIYYYIKYKSNLPHYTYSQLNYEGVKIENIHVDKLVTYFDSYEFEVSNALYVDEDEFNADNFQTWVRQPRLNHKQFAYNINVQSDKASDVVVRVFLGPKYDEQGNEIQLNENRVNFVELDKFVYNLQVGQNVIKRNSQQGDTAKDRTTYRALYQHVMAALEGKEEFRLDMSKAHNGYPSRFLLPKGKVGGQVYQFYVYISPYTKKEENTYDNIISAGVGSGSRYLDDLPFGYPFDRQIKCERTFFVSNSYVEDVVIFHKTENEIYAS